MYSIINKLSDLSEPGVAKKRKEKKSEWQTKENLPIFSSY